MRPIDQEFLQLLRQQAVDGLLLAIEELEKLRLAYLEVARAANPGPGLQNLQEVQHCYGRVSQLVEVATLACRFLHQPQFTNQHRHTAAILFRALARQISASSDAANMTWVAIQLLYRDPSQPVPPRVLVRARATFDQAGLVGG